MANHRHEHQLSIIEQRDEMEQLPLIAQAPESPSDAEIQNQPENVTMSDCHLYKAAEQMSDSTANWDSLTTYYDHTTTLKSIETHTIMTCFDFERSIS